MTRAQIAEEVRTIPIEEIRAYDWQPSDYAKMGRSEMKSQVLRILEKERG